MLTTLIFRCIILSSYLMNVLAISNNIVASHPPNNPRPKIMKPKTIKFIKRGTATGTAIGTTIPVIKELTKIPSEINNIKTKIESETGDYVQLPSEIINRFKPNYDTWSYSKLFENIDANNIASVSIHQDSKFLYVIDSKSYDTASQHIYYVTTIPSHINELINKLISYNIKVDIFN